MRTRERDIDRYISRSRYLQCTYIYACDIDIDRETYGGFVGRPASSKIFFN